LLDITSGQSIAETLAACGDSLAGLVNNAGIAVTGPVELVSVDAWRRQFEVNVIGLVAVTQALLPLLRRAQGRIAIVGSIAGRSALPGSGAYDSSKYAIEAIADALRMELQGFGIAVSLIEPGAVATPLWEKSLGDIARLRESAAPEVRTRYAALLATLAREAERSARKAITPEKVARAVEHAMTARRPKTRYVIGADAWLWLLLNRLPDRWRDRVILSQIHD
jgi:NAD(P)-dependent dehydrogenase (short-subunit alcohol dehydrogenase family)